MPSNNYIYKMSNAGGMSTLARYTDMLAGNTTWNPWEPAGAYESIAAVTVPSGGVASVTFSLIPQNYAHLQIRSSARSTLAGDDDNIYLSFNGVAGTSYSWHRMLADGSGIGVGANPSQPSAVITLVPGATGLANVFGGSVIDILDYANTSKNKTVRGIGGNDRNGSGYVTFQSFAFYNTSAITSITVTTGANIAAGSQFALYGIKG